MVGDYGFGDYFGFVDLESASCCSWGLVVCGICTGGLTDLRQSFEGGSLWVGLRVHTRYESG